MMIYNVTEAILHAALDTVNRKYGDNIRFKALKQKGHTRAGGEKWNVTLTVFSTWRKVPNPVPGERPALVKVTAPGVRRSAGFGPQHPSKRIAAACWHAHGEFFDALPQYVHTDDGQPCDVFPCKYLQTRAEVRIVTGRLTVRPGDPWNDFNIGSYMQPLMLSEACDCPDVEPVNGIRNAGERNRDVFATVV